MKSTFWDQFYEKPLEEIPWQNVQADWFKELVDNKTITGSSAMDLGCGTGQKSVYLAKSGGFKKVLGVDIAKRAIEIAKQNAKAQGVSDKCSFLCHDATDWSYVEKDRTFDFILDWANLHGIPESKRKAYVEGISRHSHKGTLLLIRVFTSKDQGLEHFDITTGEHTTKLYVFSENKLTRLFADYRNLKSNKSHLPKNLQPAKGIFLLEVLLVKS